MRDQPNRSTWLQRFVETLLLLTVFLAPVPLGGNRDWAWSSLALATGAALVGLALLHPRGWDTLSVHQVSLQVCIAAMAVVVAWSFAQTLSLSTSTSLSSFLSSATSTLAIPNTSRIAIDSEHALSALMRLLTYCGVFWLSVHLGRSVRYARALTLAIIVSALCVTAYGWMMEVTTRSCTVLFVEKVKTAPWCYFSGTFVNPNSYADLAAISALICLAIFQYRLLQAAKGAPSQRAAWRARLMFVGGIGALYLAALFAALSGLILSGSRGGLVAFAIAALTTTMVVGAARRTSVVGSIVTVALLVGGALIMRGEEFARRFFALLEEGDSDRSGLVHIALEAIAVRPLTGWGLGSFEALFPVFQPTSMALTYDKAHNVYLESAVELGIPAAALFFVAIGAIALRCLRGIRERHRDIQYSAAAIGVALYLAVHSLVDFGIQMPAIATTFAAVMGLGWAQSWSSRE